MAGDTAAFDLDRGASILRSCHACAPRGRNTILESMSRNAFGVVVLTGSLVAASATTSCISATDHVEVLTWNGTLIAADGIVDGMAGSIAMVIGEGQTQVGVSVRLAPAGERFGWVLRESGCAVPGSRVGPANVFPSIAVNDQGEGAAETVLFRRIAAAGPYAVTIHENEDGTGAVLACGDLEQN
jgi:hypothetical protein